MEWFQWAYQVVVRRDIACASRVAILEPGASQSSILFKDLKIDIGQLPTFNSMRKGNSTNTCTCENNLDLSRCIEW